MPEVETKRCSARRAGESLGGGSTRFLFPVLLILTLLVTVVAAARTSRPESFPDLSVYPWLYLRDGKPLAAGENVVEVMAVGDVMLGRGVIAEPRPFAAAAPWLRAADLALGNLEGVVAPGDTPLPDQPDEPALQPYRLYAPPLAVTALRQAGFDVLGLANNHTLDLGPAGLGETVARLQAAKLGTVGAGPNATAAYQPLIRQVGEVRLAFLAFNAVPDPGSGLTQTRASPGDESWTWARWDRAQAVAAIVAARAQANAVIVSVHWGYEYETRADPAQRNVAQAMLEAGADLVIGHHPHVVQGFHITDGSPDSSAKRGQVVAHSLGNFVFDQERDETRQGLVLRAFFDRQGLRAVQALPVWAGPRPRLMTLDESGPLLARVLPRSRLGFACDGQTCYPVEAPQTLKTGPFWAGEVDLTGDGHPERVRRAEQQAIVYRDGVEVWRSPPQWQVTDLALGDPNNDGREELLLALWKRDESGVPRSHPFIVGYRGGTYRDLWGGSPVAASIHEVELGDVDGDGVQELIVLEEQGNGSECAVTIWRWNGWGFSLMWRSAPGRYRDLVLVPGEANCPPTISITIKP
ncbi:MAG: CapA family protein [Anaerolineae bacterium]